MPRVHTHLYLGIKLLNKTQINNAASFLLGNAYPDCWSRSVPQAMENHYKTAISGDCNLQEFLNHETMDEFHLGYFFHLWVDNAMDGVDTQDISKYDCMICDMEAIGDVILQLKEEKLVETHLTEKEQLALENIQALEQEPIPLYLVDEEKKQRYENILEMLVCNFLEEYRSLL